MLAWNPVNTIPLDVPILVCLEKPWFGARVHGATYHKNATFIGGQFDYNVPKVIGWMYPPDDMPGLSD